MWKSGRRWAIDSVNKPHTFQNLLYGSQVLVAYPFVNSCSHWFGVGRWCGVVARKGLAILTTVALSLSLYGNNQNVKFREIICKYSDTSNLLRACNLYNERMRSLKQSYRNSLYPSQAGYYLFLPQWCLCNHVLKLLSSDIQIKSMLWSWECK